MFSFCSAVKRRNADGARTDLQRVASVNKALRGLDQKLPLRAVRSSRNRARSALYLAAGRESSHPCMMIFPARSQTCHCHRVRPRLLSNTSNIAGPSRSDFSVKALIQLNSWGFAPLSAESLMVVPVRMALQRKLAL